ncbi:MAG: DUF3987 domain-containing protein [Thiogranum sp.]|nr:DUF3987 domain-containing protein [Thiogranum sp.]
MHSIGQSQTGIQDENSNAQQPPQGVQYAGQYPSGGNTEIAAPASTQPERPSASAILSPGLTWPPGFTGAVAQYIYDSAPRPVPEVAIVGALGLLSGICGKAWITPTKTGLNQYIVLVARSAIGKEAMHSGVSRLMSFATDDPELHLAKHFVDYSDFASGQALQKACAANPSFVNVTGEFGHRLKQIAGSTNKPDSPMQNLRRVMTNLYSKSGPQSVAGGISYSDKDKNVLSVEGVSYSMIGETTPGTFYELLTPDMMADGFLSRFTVVEYEGERPPENGYADYFSIPYPELLNWLKIIMTHALTLLRRNETQIVQWKHDAQIMLNSFNHECDRRIAQAGDDESQRQMWNRAYLKALKLAALLAATDDYITPMITTVQVEWAIEFIKRDIGVFSRRLKSGDIGSDDDAREAKLLAITKEYFSYNPMPKSFEKFDAMRRDGIVPRKYLQQRTQKVAAFNNRQGGARRALDDAMRSLVDSGYFMEVDKLTLHKTCGWFGKAYRLVSSIDMPAPEPVKIPRAPWHR